MCKYIARLIALFTFLFCFGGGSKSFAQVTSDSVMYQRDSVIGDETDPTTLFFQQGEKLKDISKTTIVMRGGKVMTLAAWSKLPGMEIWDHVIADLDNDGKKELITYNFTGGAHCCDEIRVYKNTGPNRYQHVARLYGGHTSISDGRFQFGFYEHYGYFFTCYACGYGDTSDAAPIPLRDVTLNYKSGKLVIVPGDQDMKSIIMDNLGKLGELPYQPLTDDLMDEGVRKEIAMNLVVYYFSFGKNLAATQELFFKYYKQPDAKKVWAAFTKTLLTIKKENDL